MKWLVLIIGNFLLIISIAVAIVMNNVPKIEDPAATEAVEADSLNSGFDSLMVVNDSLLQTLETMQTRNTELQDSLKALLTENKHLREEIKALSEVEGNAKDMAKTFESMKATELRPILRKLDNHTVVNIYSNMSGRSRKKILLALDASRAADLTKLAVYSGRQKTNDQKTVSIIRGIDVRQRWQRSGIGIIG